MNYPAEKVKERLENNQILVKVGNVYKKIFLEDIEYFYTQKGAAYAHTDRLDYPLHMTLIELSNLLEGRFVRIHQSYLVNIKKVVNIDTRENLLAIGKKTLPVGNKYRHAAFRAFTFLR